MGAEKLQLNSFYFLLSTICLLRLKWKKKTLMLVSYQLKQRNKIYVIDRITTVVFQTSKSITPPWAAYRYGIYVSQMTTNIIIRSFPRSCHITGFVTRLTRRVAHVEQELLALPEFTPEFSEVSLAPSFIFCVIFCRSLFVL